MKEQPKDKDSGGAPPTPDPYRAPLSPATRVLHESLLRLAKGMLKAWEEWLSRQ